MFPNVSVTTDRGRKGENETGTRQLIIYTVTYYKSYTIIYRITHVSFSLFLPLGMTGLATETFRQHT